MSSSVERAEVVRLAGDGGDPVYEGILRQSVHGERMTASHYVMQPGGRFPDHKHDQEQMAFVLKGSMRFRVEGRPFRVDAGSMIVIQPNAVHDASAGDQGAELVSFVAPARRGDDDYQVLEENHERG